LWQLIPSRAENTNGLRADCWQMERSWWTVAVPGPPRIAAPSVESAVLPESLEGVDG
jgi:hypothetical protein